MVVLLGMAGMPVTSGFIAKFGAFTSAWQQGHEWLVIVALLASVAAFFFYLRIIVDMYMREPEMAEAPGTPPARPEVSTAEGWAIGLGVAITIAVGGYWAPLAQLILDAYPG